VGALLSKLLYLIPYIVWVFITVLLVELELIDNSLNLLLYCVFTFIVSTSLELIRNKILRNEIDMNKTRMILYFCLNVILGLPLVTILVIANLPLKIPVGLVNDNYQGTLMSWQQYLLIGYFCVWFISNAVILKPSKILNTVLLLISPIILIVSSLLSSQIIRWILF